MFNKISGLLVLGMFVSACGAGADSKFDAVVVKSHGYEEGSEWCSDFNLTSEQAHAFFSNAEELSANQYHNEYEHLDCFVKGTVSYKASSCEFTIWAGSTAGLICGDKEYLLGCQECEFEGAQ
ncbi:hypothetical protein [Kangiella marina]